MEKPLARNPSFTPSPKLRADLEARRGTEGVTGRLNQIFDRYQLITAKVPALTEQETVLLGNTLSGSYIEPLLIKHLDDELLDSDAGTPDECQALADRIRNMTLAERVALIESLGF